MSKYIQLLFPAYFIIFTSCESSVEKKSKIAFASRVDEKNIKSSQIFIMNSDGSGKTRITFNDRKDNLPSWSHDGKKIAFRSCKDTICGIYIMNADGSAIQQLTKSGQNICNPKWSPDGKWIAYEDYINNNMQLCLIKPDQEDFKQLTTNGYNINLTWSPDSKHIAFVSDRAGEEIGYEIYTMHIDSPQVVKRITFNNLPDKFPAWSPDGKQIAYVGYDTTSSGNQITSLWIINTDSSNPRKLIDGQLEFPSWSPDGKKLAINLFKEGNMDIYTINLDGSELTRLTNNGSCFMPAWSPYFNE